MKHFVQFLSVTVFSIFIGSQITEGALLVPFWQSLSSSEFYSYYIEFGPSIANFYTFLTIVAALIPVLFSIFYKVTGSAGLRYALLSSFFALLFVSSFYVYFKGANELFYQSSLSEVDLINELKTWSSWHWGRIVIECASLVFLILAFMKSGKKQRATSQG